MVKSVNVYPSAHRPFHFHIYRRNPFDKLGPSRRSNIEGGWRESTHRRGKRTAHRRMGDRKTADRNMNDRKMDDRKMAYNSITS